MFMVSSLSKIVNKFSKGIHKITCKYGQDNKKCETCRIKHKFCSCFHEYTNFKGNLI